MELKDIDNRLELTENNIHITLQSILAVPTIPDTINVSKSIYTDTNVDTWISKLPITRGGSIIIDKIIKNPIRNKELLIQRQKTSYDIFKYQLEILKEKEKDILWIMTLKEEIDDDMSMNLLFPSTYIINRLNNYRAFLDCYHLYKIIFTPFSCIFYPLSIFLTPYYYLNRYMHLNLSFFKYLTILFQFLKMMFKPSGNYRKDFIKLVTFMIYVFIYIYGMYQTFLISYITYKLREKLLIKIKGLVDFIKTSLIIIKRSNFIWKTYDIFNLNNEEVFRAIHKLDEIKYDISTIYKLWKDAEFKKSIIIILKVMYLLDVINTISKLKKSKNWTLPEYLTDDGETKIWDMGNPLLDNNQIFNPISLDKNIIITGVNAGGKTTYVKSIAANIILAQTFGIVNGCKAKVLLYDAIISFMRVRDEVGVKSYFEAETDCCNQMIMIATDLYERKKKGLFILDEPMHSTPPIEGMSVAHAIAKYLGSLEGITTIITTHFHNLISLGDNNRFINLSVNAIEDSNGYKFDYKIRKGASKQTIAIELLKKQKFNDEIINSAIEIKNKLCNENLRYDL
jgi:predicted ATPase